MTAAPLIPLTRSLDLFEALLTRVEPTQWSHPTPCADWTAQDLVNHVIAGQNRLTTDLSSPPTADSPAPTVPAGAPAADSPAPAGVGGAAAGSSASAGVGGAAAAGSSASAGRGGASVAGTLSAVGLGGTPAGGSSAAADLGHVPAGGSPASTEFDGVPAARFRASADAMLAAFAAPGVFDRVIVVPAGSFPVPVAIHLRTVEAIVHGWDLARACGLPFDVPDDLAAGELAFSGPMLDRVPPERRPFAPALPIAADAPVLDRLLALLGRDATCPA